jgi:hypothetical protein
MEHGNKLCIHLYLFRHKIHQKKKEKKKRKKEKEKGTYIQVVDVWSHSSKPLVEGRIFHLP